MSEPSEIDRRVTRLEVEVERVRQDAAAARVLAGGADRDVSAMQAQLRAHTRTLTALRETQLELRDSQMEQAREMREGFARVDAEARKNYAMLAKGQQRIVDLLTRKLGGPDD